MRPDPENPTEDATPPDPPDEGAADAPAADAGAAGTGEADGTGEPEVQPPPAEPTPETPPPAEPPPAEPTPAEPPPAEPTPDPPGAEPAPAEPPAPEPPPGTPPTAEPAAAPAKAPKDVRSILDVQDSSFVIHDKDGKVTKSAWKTPQGVWVVRNTPSASYKKHSTKDSIELSAKLALKIGAKASAKMFTFSLVGHGLVPTPIIEFVFGLNVKVFGGPKAEWVAVPSKIKATGSYIDGLAFETNIGFLSTSTGASAQAAGTAVQQAPVASQTHGASSTVAQIVRPP